MERALKATLPKGGFKDVSPTHRSIMQRVRGQGNRTTEKRFRGALVGTGVRGWTLHRRDLAGTPDFYFHREKVAVFVDGCFWHGCKGCGQIPKKNRRFWKTKIERNRSRDLEQTSLLERDGIRVIRFWEHEIAQDPRGCVARLQTLIGQEKPRREGTNIKRRRGKQRTGEIE